MLFNSQLRTTRFVFFVCFVEFVDRSCAALKTIHELHEISRSAYSVARRIQSLKLLVAVKYREVGILAGPHCIAITRLPRLPDRIQRIRNIIHLAEEAGSIV